MIDEIVLINRPALSVDSLSGDHMALRYDDERGYTISINGYDGLLIGLTHNDILQIAVALLNALRLNT